MRQGGRIRHPLAVAALTAALLLTACAPQGLSAEGEALTVAQSETLAAARFRLASEGPFGVELSSKAEDDLDHLTARLTVDPQTHRAWGTVERGPAKLAADEEVVLSPDTYLVHLDGRWHSGATPTAALRLVFSLSTDRPENAQLLRQSDARYLGAQTVNGEELDVYRLATEDGASGRTRLWLDGDGLLQRLDAGDDTQLVITVNAGADASAPAHLDTILPVEEAVNG